MAKNSKKAKEEKTAYNGKMISMPEVNPHAAGIDIGSRSHFVSVSQDNVAEFGVFTTDLQSIAEHLHAHGVKTVAMESTGFYWQWLFVTLQESGFEVFLVNARDLKNVKGHKTDVIDCRWLQLMHSIGLLTNSFQPDPVTHCLRTYVRHRKSLLEYASRYVSKMNKTLVLMNIQLSRVMSDITGESGLRVIEAILSGVRDPEQLERLISTRCKCDRQDMRKALQGNWRQDYLFELKECHDLYQCYQAKITSVDKEIERLMEEHAKEMRKATGGVAGQCPRHKHSHKNDPDFKVEQFAFELTGGVDLLAIDGIGLTTVLTMMSETGLDLAGKFPTAKHFASWLGFTPNQRISGGKQLSSKTGRKTNPLAKAIRDAANSAGNSITRLGDFFRRISFRKGRMSAITATSRKLAVIIYNMLVKKQSFRYEFTGDEAERAKQYQVKKALKILSKCDIQPEQLQAIMAK